MQENVKLALQVSRMRATAVEYKLTADHLSSILEPRFGGASTLLNILAFEIILKACFLLDRKEAPAFGHDYCDGFVTLSQRTQKAVISHGQRRFAGHVKLQTSCGKPDLASIKAFTKAWRRAFVVGRYSYESLEGETVDEANRRGQRWLDNGGRSEDADFAYYPLELEAIYCGLSEWLDEVLPVAADEALQ